MNCLSSDYRLKTTKEFNKVYKTNTKWHTTSFVVFFQNDTILKNGFVASKKVGNAVQRNSAKRRLKAVFLEYCNNIKSGQYVFVAKETIEQKGYEDLKKDFLFALKRMKLLNEKSI